MKTGALEERLPQQEKLQPVQGRHLHKKEGLEGAKPPAGSITAPPKGIVMKKAGSAGAKPPPARSITARPRGASS